MSYERDDCDSQPTSSVVVVVVNTVFVIALLLMAQVQ